MLFRSMEDVFHAQFFQTEPEVSMADLARLSQRPSEKALNFIARCEHNSPKIISFRFAMNWSRQLVFREAYQQPLLN